jgi:hypothetical protein
MSGILVSSLSERLRDPFFSLHVIISFPRSLNLCGDDQIQRDAEIRNNSAAL